MPSPPGLPKRTRPDPAGGPPTGILRNADAIVFVADSRRLRLTATLTSLVVLAVSSAVQRARQLKALRRLASCTGESSFEELHEKLAALASHEPLTRGDSPLS